MSGILRCIYNIPICGGFCAPTVNPDDSCYRHFSNEYTVPASGAFMKIGHVIEWSRFCRTCGACGLRVSDRRRKAIMLVAFLVSLFSWVLLLYPLFGVSENAALIQLAPWARGAAYFNGSSLQTFIGLKARVDRVDCNALPNRTLCGEALLRAQIPFHLTHDHVYERLVSWSASGRCPSPDSDLFHRGEHIAEKGTMCEKCANSATESVSFAIMGAITQIPQMTTDLQRSTRFGDVNCQATMGFLTSLWGCFSALMSLRSFSFSCWRLMPTRFPGHPLEFEWRAGSAFWCLVVASVLKLWDAFSHLLVSTPSARHKKPPTKVKELEEFMQLALAEADLDEEESDDESSGSDA